MVLPDAFGLGTAGIGVAMIAIGAGNAAGPLFAATPQFVGVALTVAAFLSSRSSCSGASRQATVSVRWSHGLGSGS